MTCYFCGQVNELTTITLENGSVFIVCPVHKKEVYEKLSKEPEDKVEEKPIVTKRR